MDKKTYKDKTINAEGFDRIAKETLSSLKKSSKKTATMDDYAWDLYEHLREMLGDEGLLEALIRAMDTNEAVENFEFIIQMHDIPMNPEEEKEDF